MLGSRRNSRRRAWRRRWYRTTASRLVYRWLRQTPGRLWITPLRETRAVVETEYQRVVFVIPAARRTNFHSLSLRQCESLSQCELSASFIAAPMSAGELTT